MFSIDDAKAPGPDGFSSLFFKKAWSIVGSDVCEAVEDFFRSGCLLREINCTIIALVPKIPNPSSMHDYRPISFFWIIKKFITKKGNAQTNITSTRCKRSQEQTKIGQHLPYKHRKGASTRYKPPKRKQAHIPGKG